MQGQANKDDAREPIETEVADHRIGLVLDGKFTIKEPLGRGGMGTVYRAEQHSMERDVAVKIMHAAQAEDPELVQRFLREAQTVSKLVHPNIITVFDFGRAGEHNELLYLVMELLDGRELADVLKAENRLNPRRVVHILTQVCDGIHHAHDRGLLHRDIKPDNVMLIDHSKRNRDVAKVLDFGIAQQRYIEGAERITRTGVMCGTPAYMSPEHILGDRMDPRSDVYSLGVMAFELLTGRRPFVAKTPMRLCMKHLDAPVPTFSEISKEAAALPKPLEAAVRKAMAKDPGDRPESASRFADMLVAALSPEARVGIVHQSEVHRAITPTEAVAGEAKSEAATNSTVLQTNPDTKPGTSTITFDPLAPGLAKTAVGPAVPPSPVTQLGQAATITGEQVPRQSPAALDTVDRLSRDAVLAEREVAPDGVDHGSPLMWAAILGIIGAAVTAIVMALGGDAGEASKATDDVVAKREAPQPAAGAAGVAAPSPEPTGAAGASSVDDRPEDQAAAAPLPAAVEDAVSAASASADATTTAGRGQADSAGADGGDRATADAGPEASAAQEDVAPMPTVRPKRRRVAISTTPDDAAIFINGAWAGKGRLEVAAPAEGRPLTVTVKRRGYVTQKHTLDAAAQALSVELVKRKRTKKRTGPTGTGIIE